MALVEAIRERAIDFRNRVKPPEFGANELPCRTYLEKLGPSDLAHVQRVVSAVSELNRDLQNGLDSISSSHGSIATGIPVDHVRFGVIAVGDTVRPEDQKDHAPEDIDLRVVNNLPAGTSERFVATNFIHGALTAKAERAGLMVHLRPTGTEPGVLIEFRNGLPIHVTYSAIYFPDTVNYLREERRSREYFSVLLNDETESRHLYWEPKQANEARLRRRITPRVAAIAEVGYKFFKESEEKALTSDLELLRCYCGVVEFQEALVFGEHAIKDGATTVVDWRKPPQIDAPEHRYLTVLSNIGISLRMGDLDRTRQILKGCTALYGSRGESGGAPCNPEILYALGAVINKLNQIADVGKLGEINSATRSGLDYQIVKIVNGYAAGDRLMVAEALRDINKLTNRFMLSRNISPLRLGTALSSPTLF